MEGCSPKKPKRWNYVVARRHIVPIHVRRFGTAAQADRAALPKGRALDGGPEYLPLPLLPSHACG